ncbi:hypothetical protein, partial [Streptococcus pneumoniae]|uniref:hypothetical protein n=1 Tax=Streptococcus pneumoniae TaxID=1313 RepID=UPI00195232EB
EKLEVLSPKKPTQVCSVVRQPKSASLLLESVGLAPQNENLNFHQLHYRMIPGPGMSHHPQMASLSEKGHHIRSSGRWATVQDLIDFKKVSEEVCGRGPNSAKRKVREK